MPKQNKSVNHNQESKVEAKSSDATKVNATPHKQNKNNQRNRQHQPKKDSGSKRVNYDNARESKVGQQIMKDAKSGKFNDISHFTKNPVLMQAASNISIAPILGTSEGTIEPVPGILKFVWIPNYGSYKLGPTVKLGQPGKQTEITEPPIAMNQAADSMFSFVVHANSRNTVYNATDLFILNLAGIEVFSIISAMKRAYGIAKMYRETNTYLPDTLLGAMGFDGKDLRNHLAQAWFDINNLIVQTRQIWIPNTLPLAGRWMDIDSNIYKDAPGDYAQIYVYVREKYYKYDELGDRTGGQLVPAARNANGDLLSPGAAHQTWDEWVYTAQQMISALIASEDRGIIYGDILKCYGPENIMALAEIGSDYSIDIDYSPEISMQVENTIAVDWHLMPSGLRQFENKLFPVYQKAASISEVNRLPSNWNLNFHVDGQVTPEMVLLATRFTALGLVAAKVWYKDPTVTDPGVSQYKVQNAWVPLAVGSEMVVSIKLIKETNGNEIIIDQVTNHGIPPVSGYGNVDLMAFDWHPFLYNVGEDTSLAVPTDNQVLTSAVDTNYVNAAYGDYDKYGQLTWQVARKINDVAMLSLYNVPQM